MLEKDWIPTWHKAFSICWSGCPNLWGPPRGPGAAHTWTHGTTRRSTHHFINLTLHFQIFRDSQFNDIFIFVTPVFIISYEIVVSGFAYECRFSVCRFHNCTALTNNSSSSTALHERGMHSHARTHINACTISMQTQHQTPPSTPPPSSPFCWKLLVSRSALSVCVLQWP